MDYICSRINSKQHLVLNKIITTADGSHTIYVPELDEHYHSVHGAVQESNHIFIKSGFETCSANPLSILEIGFGTGLNVLLTVLSNEKSDKEVHYVSLEKYPVDPDILNTINHREFAGKSGKELFSTIHKSQWNKEIMISNNFYLTKIETDFTTFQPEGKFDLIYFDAFGPAKQPEMWTGRIFDNISAVTKKEGIFVTYSAKGQVKRNLKAAGFIVNLLPGPPGKRQIIRAVKT
jgi:tRNA U34 5-methylaminomethyl-2-thiouridine-forming methyltransferase MnmC